MYACLCRAVTERTVRATIEDGAETAEAVARACGAGSRCGGCRPTVEGLLAEYGLSDVPVALPSRQAA
jgi:bacterioferritin-associated ferredoxin